MKKILNILLMINFLLLYYLVNSNTKLLLSINFSIHLIVKSIFSTINISKDKQYNKKAIIYTIIILLTISIPVLLITYIQGNILNIQYLNITNILCILSLITNTITNIISSYLNNKKIFYLNNIIILLINIVLLTILKNKYHILYLYITTISISLILSSILLIISKKNISKTNISLTKIKNTIISNKEKLIINFIKSSYIYISIIISYYILTNNYNISNIGNILSNTYFFGIILMNILSINIEKYIKADYSNIKNYHNIINKALNKTLQICILLMIISFPLSKIIFKSTYNIIFPIIILLLFYTLFNITLNICINNISNKKINTSLLLGLITKTILEIPLINSAYRMGYDQILGSIIANSLGMLITIIISTTIIIKEYKINLSNNFNNILNIIYTNIIYLLILIIFTLIIKVDNNNYYLNLGVILFYILITIIFNIIKKKLSLKY